MHGIALFENEKRILNKLYAYVPLFELINPSTI